MQNEEEVIFVILSDFSLLFFFFVLYLVCFDVKEPWLWASWMCSIG